MKKLIAMAALAAATLLGCARAYNHKLIGSRGDDADFCQLTTNGVIVLDRDAEERGQTKWVTNYMGKYGWTIKKP